MLAVAELFETEGALARHVAGFSPRPQQRLMAEAVADALSQRETLVVEAGTGTGKTYAYLVPALLAGGKIIISTGTRNLQDQLYQKDVPVVRDALAAPARVALLKGRGNYLCRYRLQLAEGQGRWPSQEQAAEFARVRAWAGQTASGDIAEVAGVAEASPLWPQVTSTVDNCLGMECPCWRDCHVVKARRKAIEADIVVINHHLFFADLAVKQEGFGELLPDADAFIFDEAHQLPEVANQFFGLSVSSRQLNELANDTLLEQRRDAADFVALLERVEGLLRATLELRLALGMPNRRFAWREAASQGSVQAALENLQAAVDTLHAALQEGAARGKGLENCARRGETLAARLRAFSQPVDPEAVRWVETFARGFSLNLTPLGAARELRERMAGFTSAWVFTSATLAVADSFQHFADRLGLEEPRTLRLDSPFDFAHNALLYQPRGLPSPASPRYVEALVEAALPVLEASRGRAFMLFTSHRALREAVAALADRLPYPLLIQGSSPKRELLDRFRALGNAVLLGTASFWEGVDVRGETLSCVIIDKLPFAPPDDPVLQGRIEAMRRRGQDPFLDHQLPQAVIALKQGVGRLIRGEHDRGVLMLCDPRLLTKGYGRVFLNSLPPMARSQDLADVRHFFVSSNHDNGAFSS